MKKILTLLILAPIFCAAQFHVQVEPNPANDGKVNPKWMNNYVVSFTLDDWKTKVIVKSQLTYYSYDDNGAIDFISYYDIITFQRKHEAIALAKKLRTPEITSIYLRDQLILHHRLNKKFSEGRKILCFGCKKSRTIIDSPTVIY